MRHIICNDASNAYKKTVTMPMTRDQNWVTQHLEPFYIFPDKK